MDIVKDSSGGECLPYLRWAAQNVGFEVAAKFNHTSLINARLTGSRELPILEHERVVSHTLPGITSVQHFMMVRCSFRSLEENLVVNWLVYVLCQPMTKTGTIATMSTLDDLTHSLVTR